MSQRTFVVVVESDHGRKSRTVGPYHNQKLKPQMSWRCPST
jgi:hypothetical protein